MKGRWVTGVCGIRLKIDGKGLWHGIYKFRSVAQSCPTLCDPMDCSTTGLPVYHQLPEFTQTPVLLPGKSHGRRSLVGCSPWGHEELDTTRRLHFHFSLSCIREGNGNPLQCSCLENPRDEGAWWAAVYGVTQSQTWLKRLSSSNWISNNQILVLWSSLNRKFQWGIVIASDVIALGDQ